MATKIITVEATPPAESTGADYYKGAPLNAAEFDQNLVNLRAAVDRKASLSNPTFTGTVVLPATTSIGDVSATELQYINGVTSNVQDQINSKQAAITAHTSNTSNPHSVTATQVGLGNVTNESKATMFTSPTFTGTVNTTGNTNLGDAAGDITTFPDLKALQVTSASRPSIRPSLLLDFANTKALDPRITFSRASTGSYYDGKTVAKAEENLLTYSEQFDNVIWTKDPTKLSVTANSAVAPDGATTADTITASSTLTHSLYQAPATAISGNAYTMSVYAKAGTSSAIQLAFFSAPFGVNAYANFNLSSGTVSVTGSAATASITSVGNSWYRCVVTATATSGGSHGWQIFMISSDTAARAESWTAAGTETLYLWGAQFEQRSSVNAYTPTTTAPITNYIPALQTAAAGVARFDHNPTTGESLGLLIEEQRTNLLTYSDKFNDASWSKAYNTVSADVVTAPDGAIAADKIVETTNSTGVRYHSVHKSAGTLTGAYTSSVYAKKGERNFLWITVNGTANYRAVFNLTDGSIAINGAGVTANAVPVGNGWWRCSVTYTLSSATGYAYYGVGLDASTVDYTGDGTSGIYIWGAQLEAGSFATSYIPTTSAQVTRAADAASMTGTNFSSWYRADQGTIYAELSAQGYMGVSASAMTFLSLSDGTLNNRMRIFLTGTTSSQFQGSASNVSQFAIDSTYAIGSFYKYTGAYKTDDFAYSVNGGAVGTDTSGVVPSCTQLQIGNFLTDRYTTGTIKKLAYYPKRLTNTELQGVTA